MKEYKKRGKVSLLSSDEIDDMYNNYYTWYILLTGISAHKASNEIKKEIVYCLINSVKVIQQAWKIYRLKSET